MMDWTDRHCRYFHRLLAPSALLYTEMVHSAAIIHGDRERLLGNAGIAGPVALQLGGSDPAQMAAAAKIGEQFGYDEININVGCPSDRVQSGQFGACLMARPQTVADCVAAMRDSVSVPVTVKTRIGIDDQDSYAFLLDFIDTVAAAGCTSFIVHARIAILAGLSPKQNREIPPLNYPRVHRLATERGHLTIALNGGLKTRAAVREQLNHVHSAMIGRAAYQTPYFLAELEHELVENSALPTRLEIMEQLLEYARRECAAGIPLRAIARHTLGLFQGMPGARRYRRALSEGMHDRSAGVHVLQDALAQLDRSSCH